MDLLARAQKECGEAAPYDTQVSGLKACLTLAGGRDPEYRLWDRVEASLNAAQSGQSGRQEPGISAVTTILQLPPQESAHTHRCVIC